MVISAIMSAPRKRLTREESKAATREKLLAAASKAFARYGFAAISVDEIAESAGFSRGAFYSNFKSKDELFLTVVEREIRAWSLEVRDIVSASSSAEETLLGLRKFYGVVKERDKDAQLLIAEARLYAARNGQFKSKLSALFREVHEELTSVLERFQTQAAIKNGIAADQLVLIAIALNHGLVMHHLMDPRHYPDHLVTASSELVFDKLMGFTGR
jgi:AcrR family transcriptional regulator